jgi:hypothetical protein
VSFSFFLLLRFTRLGAIVCVVFGVAGGVELCLSLGETERELTAGAGRGNL